MSSSSTSGSLFTRTNAVGIICLPSLPLLIMVVLIIFSVGFVVFCLWGVSSACLVFVMYVFNQ